MFNNACRYPELWAGLGTYTRLYTPDFSGTFHTFIVGGAHVHVSS